MISIKGRKGFFPGFLIGGLIGGVFALLYAPKSGKYLRNDISKKTNELIEDGKKIAVDTWNDAKNRTEVIDNDSHDMLNKGMEKVERETKKVKDKFNA